MAKDDSNGIVARILKENGISNRAFGNPLVSEEGDHEFEVMMANVTKTFAKAEAVVPKSTRKPHFQPPTSDQFPSDIF